MKASFQFLQTTQQTPRRLEAPPAVLKASGTVSEREYVEIEVIKLLLTNYYNIVKKTVTDMIPKCIMLNLVNYAREEMQRALLAELYKEDLLEDLLKESADTVTRRKECKKMIEALQKPMRSYQQSNNILYVIVFKRSSINNSV